MIVSSVTRDGVGQSFTRPGNALDIALHSPVDAGRHLHDPDRLQRQPNATGSARSAGENMDRPPSERRSRPSPSPMEPEAGGLARDRPDDRRRSPSVDRAQYLDRDRNGSS
jgi:hypothetical protein